MKKAFSIVELLIVISVIGVLSAIFLPAANRVTPDEQVLKFKKAHNTVHDVFNRLVNSNEYFLNGDLGVRYDGVELSIEGNFTDNNKEYLCEVFSDVISAKYTNCYKIQKEVPGGQSIVGCHGPVTGWSNCYNVPNNKDLDKLISEAPYNSYYPPGANLYDEAKKDFDRICKENVFRKHSTEDKRYIFPKQIIAQDGVWFYDPSPTTGFRAVIKKSQVSNLPEEQARIFSAPGEKPTFYDQYGNDRAYKVFCFDIDGFVVKADSDGDGIDNNVKWKNSYAGDVEGVTTEKDCVNECPFGYGIRADGKILNGARAEEWLKKK